MHIAPSGSPQPTKQAFICKLYSGFPHIFSQQKPHRRICIPQGARNEVLQGTQPETSAHFSVMFFRKTRKISADVQAYFKRNLMQYSGNSARTSAHFSAMFFRKTRKMSADVQAYSERNLTQYSGNSARTSNHFSAMFFRKTRKMSDGVLSVLRAKFDAVFGKLSPNPSTFFGDVFSQDKASKPPLYTHTARRKKRSFTENSARTSNHFSVMFFRKTRKMSDGVLSVLRAKFDAVLRKNSPKNQISIMSASFFFAISSISLTYLSVIF